MPATLKARRPEVASRHQLLQIADLTKGVNIRTDPTLVEAEQAVTLRNWDIDTPGALTVRPGFSQFSTGGSVRLQGGERIYLSSHTFTLIAEGQEVKTVSAAGARSTVLSGLSTNQVYFPHDRDLVAVMDGTNRPRKSTDGSTWTLFGIDGPSSNVPTVSTLSSGVCSSGRYEFAYSYKNRALSYESNISSGSTITLSGSTGAFHLTATASTDGQVDAFVWYARDLSAGETVFRKASSGADSTVRITSTAWTQNAEAPTNHDVLSKGTFGRVWKNRWWIVDPDQGNRLRFSELFLPQAFPALYYIDIPFERGDSIAALMPLGDVLVVFGQAKAFLIIGQTSLDFEVRPSAGAVSGCLGPRAIDVVEQGIVHASAEGVFIFDGATDRLLTYLIDPGWRDYIANTSGQELTKTPLVYEQRRKAVRIAVTRAYPTAVAGEWELNLNRSGEQGNEAWVQTDRTVGGYIHFSGSEPTAGDRGELLTWSDTNGDLYKESTGTTANSSNLTATYEGPSLAFGLHRSRVLALDVEYEPNDGSLTEETLVDGVSQGARTLSIGSAISLWGSAVWGTALWGGSGRRKGHRPRPLSANGRTAQQKFVYAGKKAFKVFSYAFTILPESQIRGFSE